jgi:large repetitive protein
MTFENLRSGTYTVLVYDSALGSVFDFNNIPGFNSRDWDNIGEFRAVEADLVYNADDSGAGDGSVSAVITYTSGPVEYYLNDQPMPSGDFTNLRKGNYVLRLVDTLPNVRCPTFINFKVAQTMVANLLSVSPTCKATGQISVNITGGEPPYQYRMLALPGEEEREPQLGSTFTGVPLGDRSIVVIDSRGVQASLNVTVPFAVNGVNITGVTTRNASSPVAKDGTATIRTINAGVGTSFRITSRDGFVVREQTNGTFVGLLSGLYSVDVVDAFGCPARSEFQIFSAITVEAYASAAACKGLSPGNGRITANFAFGAMPYNVTLGTENVLLFSSTYTFENLVPGSYNLSVVDALQTQRTFVVEVPSYEFDAVNFWLATPSLNPEGQLASAVAFFSEIRQFFEWKLSDSISWENAISSNFIRLRSGSYTLQTRDSRGCTRDLDFTVPAYFGISASTAPVAGTICEASLSSVTITVDGGQAPFRFMLTGASVSYPWQASPVFENLPVGTYVVNAEYDFFGQTYSAIASFGVSPNPRPLRTPLPQLHVSSPGI